MKLKELVLNIEQMKHLKSLGVDTSNAAIVLIYKDDDGNEVAWDDVTFIDGEPFYTEDGDPLYENYLDAENGDYDHSYREDCGLFTLQEVLKLLPDEIKVSRKRCYPYLDISNEQLMFTDMLCLRDQDGTMCLHDDDKDPDTLIDEAYNMLVWVIENGYFKKED